MSVRAICRGSLVTIVLVLALPAAALASGETQPRLTPAQVRVVADEAGTVRGLVRIEDSLTHDAVAVQPSRRALAARIRKRNQLLIEWFRC